MATFQRNAIIAGYINSYCLVCECFFESEEQTFSHIETEEHGARLLSCPHLEKYGNNGIRKVKAGYFCEYCGLLMATAAKVNLHIAEKPHYHNKGNSLLKQSGAVLTAFDDVLISESAWHSFADDACALCNAEFDDQHEHMIERAHIVKLLQSKVEFEEDNNLYRRIDKNYFQCLTCNCVPALSTLEDHFNEENHKQKYIQCQELKKKYDLEHPKEKENKIIKEQKIESKDGKIVDQNGNVALVSKGIKKDETNKDDKSNPQPIDTKQAAIPEKETKPEKKAVKSIQKEQSSDPAIYAKDNQLTYEPQNTNAFCATCAMRFPSNLQNMMEHVQGRGHISRTAKSANKSAPKKTKLDKRLTEDFVKSVYTVNNTVENDTVINDTICVAEKSCHMFTKNKNRFAEYKCHICSMNVPEDGMGEHCGTMQHEKGMRQIPVITNLKNEFIREVHPDTFHCGFCNVIIPAWHATVDHLKTMEHKNCAASCSRRLKISLAQHREDKEKAAFFEMFIHHMRFN